MDCVEEDLVSIPQGVSRGVPGMHEGTELEWAYI